MALLQSDNARETLRNLNGLQLLFNQVTFVLGIAKYERTGHWYGMKVLLLSVKMRKFMQSFLNGLKSNARFEDDQLC